jgi:tetratricopeptide (TPR) repeat protein
LVDGDLVEAERQFAAAREMDPELAVAWLGLAEVLEYQERPEDALLLARRARELAPEEAVVHRVVGRLLARTGADDAALEALGQARQLAPDVPEPYLLAGLLLRRNGRIAEAAKLLEEGLGAGADTPDLRRELILLLLADSRPAKAILAAEKAVVHFPDVSALEVGLGLALAAVPERREEAPAWLEKALLGEVDRPERVRFELGTVLLEIGQAETARPHLEAAAEGMPGAPTVWYRLARARQASGDGQGAAAAMPVGSGRRAGGRCGQPLCEGSRVGH